MACCAQTSGPADFDPSEPLASTRARHTDDAPIHRHRPASAHATGRHRLDAGDRPTRQEGQQGLPVKRGPIGQAKAQAVSVRVGVRSPGLWRGTTQVGRRQPVVTDKTIVESPHAGKARSQRDFSDRQCGVGQQSLGQQQPVRLRVFDRRDSKLRIEDPAQMPIGHAQTAGHLRDAALGQDTVFDERSAGLRQAFGRINTRIPRGEFRSTAQAGPIPIALSQRGRSKETAVFESGRARRADRTAIDAGAAHPNEKSAIEARIARAQGPPAAFGIKTRTRPWRGGAHGRIIAAHRRYRSPFSDITAMPRTGSLQDVLFTLP